MAFDSCSGHNLSGISVFVTIDIVAIDSGTLRPGMKLRLFRKEQLTCICGVCNIKKVVY